MIFQIVGTCSSRYEAFKINVIGWARTYDILLIPNWAICLAHLLYLLEVLTEHFALLFPILLGKLIFLSTANLATKIVACIPPKVPECFINFICLFCLCKVRFIGSCLLSKLMMRFTSLLHFFGLSSFNLSMFSS